MKDKNILKTMVIVLVVVLCLVALLLSPIFHIKHIAVQGNQHYTQEEIAQSLHSVTGQNYFVSLFSNVPFSHLDYLFKGRLYQQEQNLKVTKPYIKNIEISYDFPDALTVNVTERKPSFLTKCQGEYILVDEEGYVLEVFSQENKPDYPVVEGLNLDRYKAGKTLQSQGNNSSNEKLALSIRLCSLMIQSQFLEEYIDIVDVTNPNSIWMFASPSLSIKFGNSDDLSMKISVLKGIFKSGYDGNSNGVIDFTSGKNPIFKKNTEDSANPNPSTPSPEPDSDSSSGESPTTPLPEETESGNDVVDLGGVVAP